MRARLLAALVFLLAGARPGAPAEWHEAYRDGLKALGQGQAARAVPLLEAAASQRPEPGRNVITYGTNFVERYYPYLHLAEAYIQLRDLGGARSALERSEKWAREPADERRKLAVQAEELAARLAPRPAATPAPARPAEAASAPPVPSPSEASPSITPAPSAAPATPAAQRTAVPGPARATPPATAAPEPRAPAPPEATARLDVASQPPGASVYLDDELIGTTDAEWGRLMKRDIAPGHHRVRLALIGHRDVVEEIDVAPSRRTEFRRRLAPLDEARFRPPLALVIGGGLLVVALAGWALHRRRAAGVVPLRTPPAFDTSGATPLRNTPPSPAHHAGPGEAFGEYALLGTLGRGGMATVYRAERRGEICALKRPLGAFLEEPTFRERFLREAEIGRTLHHPNIVRILERGEVGAVPFFTMELLEGETLQALLQRRGVLPPREAVEVVVQIAEALDYAHLKGVVHRDLKPSNVMVLADGAVKVMDYGIARAQRFEGLTVTGAFLGTPEYAPPEAIQGRNTDARSDLYSLGVLFYELLTGRRPFTADTPFALLQKHLSEMPAPPSRLRADLPAALERIALRLLHKRASQRYPGAEQLVLDLRDFLNHAA